MRLKRNCHALASTLPRPPHNLAKHVRVRAMHSVKVPHADQRRPKIRRNIFEFVKNLHELAEEKKRHYLWNPLKSVARSI
jgi:hypothetical protein